MESWTIEAAEKITDEDPTAGRPQARRVVCQFSLRSGTQTARILLEMKTPWLDFKAGSFPNGDLRVAFDVLDTLRDTIRERLEAGERDIHLDVPEDMIANCDPTTLRMAVGSPL